MRIFVQKWMIRNEKIGKKIRDTELMKVPYMLVVGEKEMNEEEE